MKRSALTTSIVGITILASCGGGGNDTADPTTPTTIESTAPAPTVAPTSTSTTMPPPTTSSITTTSQAPPGTTAPTTPATTAPTTEEAIVAGFDASQEAFFYAVYNLDAADGLDRMRATTTGESLERGLAIYEEIVSNGWRARPNPDVPDRSIVVEPVNIIDSSTAALTICQVGSAVVYAPGANADGSDLIINDEIGVRLMRATMVLEGGVWKLFSGTTTEDLEGPEACDAF